MSAVNNLGTQFKGSKSVLNSGSKTLNWGSEFGGPVRIGQATESKAKYDLGLNKSRSQKMTKFSTPSPPSFSTKKMKI